MTDFEQFYSDLKQTEQRDAVLTPDQQITRLLRPGSTYLNLNPFEVLQIEPETEVEQARKKYKRLSILVHPDKNPDDRERAQKAFDILKKAIETVEDPDELSRCRDIYTEAKGRLAIVMSEKRRKLKREGKSDKIEEDDVENYKKALWVTVTKVWSQVSKLLITLKFRFSPIERRSVVCWKSVPTMRKDECK